MKHFSFTKHVAIHWILCAVAMLLASTLPFFTYHGKTLHLWTKANGLYLTLDGFGGMLLALTAIILIVATLKFNTKVKIILDLFLALGINAAIFNDKLHVEPALGAWAWCIIMYAIMIIDIVPLIKIAVFPSKSTAIVLLGIIIGMTSCSGNQYDEITCSTLIERYREKPSLTEYRNIKEYHATLRSMDQATISEIIDQMDAIIDIILKEEKHISKLESKSDILAAERELDTSIMAIQFRCLNQILGDAWALHLIDEKNIERLGQMQFKINDIEQTKERIQELVQ